MTSLWLRIQQLVIVVGGLVAAVGTLIIVYLSEQNPNFLFALPLVFVFIIVMVMKTEWMLMLLVMMRALSDSLLVGTRVPIMGQSIGIGGAFNLLIILIFVFYALRFTKDWFRLKHHLLWWACFLGIAFISVFYAYERGAAARLWLNLNSVLAMFSLAWMIVDSEEKRKFWIKLLLASTILPVLCSIAGIVTKHPSLFQVSAGRVSGSFSHPNILAFYLIWVTALLMYVQKSNVLSLRSGHRNFLNLFLVTVLGVLIFTKTRSAWISCWFFFFAYGFLKEKKYLWFSLLLPPLALLVPQVQDRFADLLSGTSTVTGAKLNSLSWRFELWQVTMPQIFDSLWIGYGLASFDRLSGSFFDLSDSGVGAHNTYLQFWFEVGIFGVLAFIFMQLQIVKDYFKKMKSSVGDESRGYAVLLAFMASFMVASISDNMPYYLSLNWYVWFLMGLILKPTTNSK